MLNYLWAGMIMIGIVCAAFTGRIPEITNAALDSSKEAVTLCITMMGVMSFWVGMMEIASQAGVIQNLSRRMGPIIHFLFPQLPKNHPAREHITTNIISNVLGLGWAATPAGLKAMEELEKLEEERRRNRSGAAWRGKSGKENRRIVRGKMREAVPRGVASNEMCTFLILNISSLQLIPMNVIAYRSQYGSVNPTAIVGPAIVATAVSTVAAIIFCKVMDRNRK